MPIVYLSLDPQRKEINFYPKPIAEQIESKFKECRSRIDRSGYYNIGSCVLGRKFFNATVHFHINGMYQTTPGLSMGRGGFKVPGFRSVKRLNVLEEDLNYYIYGKRINEEWRIAENEAESELTFSGEIENKYLIDDQIESLIQIVPETWEPKSLNQEEDYNKFVVVWQWCRGTFENDGDLLSLGEEWWIPYFNEQNKAIENCFEKENGSLTIKIPEIDKEFEINIKNGSFGSQENLNLNTRREIKRSIITVFELKKKLENSRKLVSYNKLLEYINNKIEVPIEFICPISQNIMEKPVKTIDNQIYDEKFIKKWFLYGHDTSPCTGLPLKELTLTPFIDLENQINLYIEGIERDIN